AESRTNRTASSLNSSVDRRRVLVIILSSDFIILLLLEVSVKSGEGHPVVLGQSVALGEDKDSKATPLDRQWESLMLEGRASR
ncbi:MAG TPA: hypothetical protein VN666_08705, partial [Nitrospira sp.]|nr:hypothetical protein [Nitrospira sp.]